MSCCSDLIKAIDRYIQKADNDLAQELKKKGYKDPKKTVKTATALEEAFSEAIRSENKTIVDMLADCETVEEFYKKYWPKLKADGNLKQILADAYRSQITALVEPLVQTYLEDTDPLLPAGALTQRTTGWIKSWSGQLGELMKLDNAEKLESILVDGIDEGKGIGKIIQELRKEGIRDTYAGARRTAITEVLGAHSVAHQEAIEQDPAVNRKCWRHSGSAKTKPRENHVAMDGQTVPKDKPFTLNGADGVTYYPMFPRDTLLPAGERINCHCLSQAIVDDDVLGMSLEDRKRLQAEARAKIDADYAAKLDAENKAKAGINEETIRIDAIRQKSKSAQIKSLGKSRWALLESGVVTKDEQLFRTVSTPNGKITVRKTLQEMRKGGIISVPASAVRHAYQPHYSRLANPKKPPSLKNGGRPSGGGHSQHALDAIQAKGWTVEITGTYENGVRVGNIPESTDKFRRSGSQMSWFPETWTEEDILLAGTTVSNNPSAVEELISREQVKSGERLTGTYNDVVVCVTKDTDGKITSIYPRNSQ